MNDKSAQTRWAIIKDYIQPGSVGVELGVFKGHFSPYLLTAKPRTLFLVDPWYRLGANWRWVKDQDSSTLNAFQEILTRFKTEINSGTAVPVVDFSVPFLNTLSPKSLDFIYLDSSHAYEDTKNEIAAASRVLKDDGVLLGDDWRDDPQHRHYGVAKAVKEYIDAGKCTPLFNPKDCQWGVKFL